jgi:hypothetical protein
VNNVAEIFSSSEHWQLAYIAAMAFMNGKPTVWQTKTEDSTTEQGQKVSAVNQKQK